MSSYKQIKAQIVQLERQAEEAKKAETATVVEKLRKSIALYGLTAADIGFDADGQRAGRSRPAAKKAARPAGGKAAAKKATRPGAGMAKYRDPDTGRTWSGFGRVPAWIASAADREALRIGAGAGKEPAAAPALSGADARAASASPATKATRKAGVKTAARKTATKSAPAGTAAAKKRAGTGTARKTVAKPSASASMPAESPDASEVGAAGADPSADGTAAQAAAAT